MSVLRFRKMPEVQAELRPARNQELEILRNEGLSSRVDDEKVTKDLASELALVHSAFLFYGCGKLALSKLCLVVASSPASSVIVSLSSWKDLAALMGLSFHEIGYIENMHSDCIENVLKTYAANERDGTLDKIIMALFKLKRFDAITEAMPHLKDLANFVRSEEGLRTVEKPTDDRLLRPSGWRHFKTQLPHALRRYLDTPIYDESISTALYPRIEDNTQQATIIDRRQPTRNKCSKVVMLTFAKDGEKTAYDVAAQLRKPRGHYLPIGVLILEEQYDRVEANPIQFITKFFEKVDYIVPIVTPQYLDFIEKPPPEESTWSALDTRYIQMIHTLMGYYYLENSCKNDKFRSIIPDNYVNSLLNDYRMKRDPLLQAFVTESKLEHLALRILKRK